MASPHIQPSRQGGATLIEALVVMSLFAMGMVALAQMQSGIALWTEAARQRAEAARLARQKLSELRAQGQAAAALNLAHVNTYVASSTADEVFSMETTSFRCHWKVHAAAHANFRTVVVTIAWNDRSGPQTLTLQSLIARLPTQGIARLRLPTHHETTTSLAHEGNQ